MIEEIAVARIVEMHPKQTPVVLNLPDGVTTCAYASAYGFPEDEFSGLGEEAAAHQTAVICLHQQGEAYAPYVDCWITKADGATKFNVDHVQTSLNFQAGVAAHTCTCSRKA
jgi:hypothetical protein